MIFTVGNEKSYNAAIEQSGNIMKKGQDTDYPGGCVFQTKKEAQDYIDLEGFEGYLVWGVDADWQSDVAENTEQPYHNLLIDADIIKIDQSPGGDQ